MAKRFQQRLLEVDGVQYNGTNHSEVIAFHQDRIEEGTIVRYEVAAGISVKIDSGGYAVVIVPRGSWLIHDGLCFNVKYDQEMKRGFNEISTSDAS